VNSLFSVFDPVSSVVLVDFNWFAMVLVLFFLFPRFFFSSSTLTVGHKNIISLLSNEFGIAIGKVYSPGLAFLLVRIFYFILYSNFLGLIPYIFTPTRHLAVTVSLTLPLWVGYITFIILKNLNSFLRHLVPRGTPYVLIPFMVIIEIIRISIRPLTLSVRLAANIIAGHILIVLVRRPLTSVRWIIFPLILISLGLLVTLEVAVSIIQSYVFRTLISLYIIEVNSPNF